MKWLKEREVSDRTSVRDGTYELSKIQLIVDQQTGKETLAKVSKYAREIAVLFPEGLPGGYICRVTAYTSLNVSRTLGQ